MLFLSCLSDAAVNSSAEIGAFYLGTLLLKDASGNTYTAKEIIEYTIKNARKPAIGLNYAFIKLGLYGGASVDFYAMGKQAGEKVAKVLSGVSHGTLPIEDAQRSAALRVCEIRPRSKSGFLPMMIRQMAATATNTIMIL